MIRVTQGHEKSISLEVFIKSFLCLSPSRQQNLILYCYKESLEETLSSIKIQFTLEEHKVFLGGAELNLCLEKESGLQSLNTLERAIEELEPKDILLTLPTSKDQFINVNGHTEYFRKRYGLPTLPMSFASKNLNVALLTDHLPLSQVSSVLTKDYIVAKMVPVLQDFPRYKPIERVIFSGINPHNGESGLMGNEELQLEAAIEELKTRFPHLEIIGPLPGDTLMFKGLSSSDLAVFAAHDQGLGIFKLSSGFQGINITFGLPFLRLSPDHGTAFELFGKNVANYQGCLYILEEFC